jgi:hypothetical protein
VSKKLAKQWCEEQVAWTEFSGTRFEPKAMQGILFGFNERGQPIVGIQWKRDQHNRILLNSTMPHLFIMPPDYYEQPVVKVHLGRMYKVDDDISYYILRDVEEERDADA